MDNKDVTFQQRRRWFSLRIAMLFIFGAALLLGATLGFFSPGHVSQAHAATWNQVWSDEFNGAANTGVNPSNWLYDTGTGYGCAGCPGNWGTGEVESETTSTSNVYQDGNGHLVIKAINNGGNWTSGRIETQNTSFAAPAGGELAVEASIQQPNVSGAAAAGYWPAFWMLGSAFRGVYTNWPGIGEVDIMEDINGLSSEFGTLHCGVDPGGPCNETTGLGSGQHACAGCQTAYHTYRVEIDRSTSPEQIRWYLDGTNFFSLNSSQVDATTWANAVDHSFFIILNLAVGGAFPAAFGGGPTAATQSGASLNVDYVRVYTANGNVTPTPSTTGATATPTTAGLTPTPTPTTGGSGFTQGVTAVSGSQAQFWFQPTGWTAGYVILHYIVSGQTQQNITMTYNSGSAQWQYTVSGLSPGQTITYWYTYQQSGNQHDSSTYTYTVGSGGSTPTPTPTPTATSTGCTGTFTQGVNNVSGSQAQFWFTPCSWTAGYVIVHYTVPGQVQQNVNLAYNSSTARWEYTAGGMSAGQVITYSFTYQMNGTQYDSGTYTWTHP